jgi:hypothetical protein
MRSITSVYCRRSIARIGGLARLVRAKRTNGSISPYGPLNCGAQDWRRAELPIIECAPRTVLFFWALLRITNNEQNFPRLLQVRLNASVVGQTL